jgi:dTDP-4-dehydrorhamnose reductase
MTYRVLVLGAGGQLGQELQLTVPRDWHMIALPRDACDLSHRDQINSVFLREKPQAVINAAAYTAVDKAESEPELAYAVNHEGPAYIAQQCAAHGSRLLHISTDFVFSGDDPTPLAPAAPVNPLGVYGASKLAGERAVLASGADAIVLRTSWVYSRFGHNFVKTMLRLLSQREELAVVADQVGSPTWAKGLAIASWQLLRKGDALGIYHWADAGVCSWYDFAVAIAEEAQDLDMLQKDPLVRPITTADYPTPAKRPRYSVLDHRATHACLGTEPTHWRQQLRQMLVELRQSSLF